MRRGFSDLFVSKLDPTGSELAYSTLFGGSGAEMANSEPGVRLAVDDAGRAYVGANTESRDLPLERAFEVNPSGRFVVKLSADGGALEYSSYVNFLGFGIDAVALDPYASPGAVLYAAGPSAEPRGIAAVGIAEDGAACVGDCDGDGEVSESEVVTGVARVLGELPASACGGFSEGVDVAELVRAVNDTLQGCA
jgi:hypothetical protein